MTELESRVWDQVRRLLGAARLDSAIVYLDDDLRRAGDRVAIGDAVIELPWDAHLAFVDLEPAANWGHACAYVAVRHAGDEAVQVAAQLPPFLKAGASRFRLLRRGPLAPPWAVATSPQE